jgi:protocatechuate 3,4-dioxygenase beta subunit
MIEPARLSKPIALALLIFAAQTAFAVPGKTTATGIVNDARGQPLANATVFVYSAGVRTGYNAYCPTCYSDCGKRTTTDTQGRFSIPGLDDELLFNLLVVKDGYAATWIQKVDPLKGEATPVAVNARTPIEDLRRVLRGKVVDANGTPVPDALVEGIGAIYGGANGQPGGRFGGGPIFWSDVQAISDSEGEFEIAHAEPAANLIVSVAPRGRAPTILTAPTGAARTPVIVTDGVTVHGRVMKGRKPQANVELGLSTVRREAGMTFPEIRVSTDKTGRFAFTNVPPNRVWSMVALSGSLQGRGAIAPVYVRTGPDGKSVNAGDIRLQPSVRMTGRIQLVDGKPMPDGMSMMVSPGSLAGGTQVVPIRADGTFDISDLLPGPYVVRLLIQGYRQAPADYGEVLLDRDMTDLVFRAERLEQGAPAF